MNETYIFTARKGNKFHQIKVLLFSVTSMAVACLLYTFNPADSFLYAPCPFYALTGLYCPGCGSLRAIHQLLHMHFLSAFKLNPLLFLSTPLLGYLLSRSYFFRPKKYPLSNVNIPAFLIWIYLGVVISFWIIRNIPLYPFSLLIP